MHKLICYLILNYATMSTEGQISLKSEYFRISTATVVGMKDATAEMEYLERWKKRAMPVMEKLKVMLEERIGGLQLDLNLPLLAYDDVYQQVSEEGIDPESVRRLVEFGYDRPFRYLMRLRQLYRYPGLEPLVDDVDIQVVFSTLPARSKRSKFKMALVSLLTGQPIMRVEEEIAPGTHEEVDLQSKYVHVSTSVVARMDDIGPEIEFLRAWKNNALPLMAKIRDALEKEIQTLESSHQFPLLYYSDTFRAVEEEEIYPESVSLVIKEGYKPPFRYGMRFRDIQGLNRVDVEVGLSALPEKGVRDSLKKTLEAVIRGVLAKNGTDPEPDERIREPFGDYWPKKDHDTVYDYLPKVDKHEEYEAILKKLPPAELKNLKELLVLFDEYNKRTKKNPGRYVEGNMLLGALPLQYEPSGDELVLAEIGSRIKNIVKATPREQLIRYLKKEKITAAKIDYNYFTFIHYDVMGSGRFFYASNPIKEIVSFE